MTKPKSEVIKIRNRIWKAVEEARSGDIITTDLTHAKELAELACRHPSFAFFWDSGEQMYRITYENDTYWLDVKDNAFTTLEDPNRKGFLKAYH